jgi:hypothetical protein
MRDIEGQERDYSCVTRSTDVTATVDGVNSLRKPSVW